MRGEIGMEKERWCDSSEATKGRIVQQILRVEPSSLVRYDVIPASCLEDPSFSLSRPLSSRILEVFHRCSLLSFIGDDSAWHLALVSYLFPFNSLTLQFLIITIFLFTACSSWRRCPSAPPGCSVSPRISPGLDFRSHSRSCGSVQCCRPGQVRWHALGHW
jgi:hypothetical protein